MFAQIFQLDAFTPPRFEGCQFTQPVEPNVLMTDSADTQWLLKADAFSSQA